MYMLPHFPGRGRIGKWLRERGLSWTSLYLLRGMLLRLLRHVDRAAIEIERRRYWTGPETIASLYHRLEENRVLWDQHDWAQAGEEWTQQVREFRNMDPDEWKAGLINGMLIPWIPEDKTVLEIGPGAGRWSEVLCERAARLLLADISATCLDLCRRRFADKPHVEYWLIGEDGLSFIPDDSIDAIWSYDVFVHINPTDIASYINDFRRILKPGGVAVIHHAGEVYPEALRTRGWRSAMTREFFAHLVHAAGLSLVLQDESLVHMPGDVISVFKKPA
jgi:SAM-dependent methyltransferase